mmetsp:Transcript_16641/g.39187  ORF Transcript_16641/g.39187 Transcript_16641/m.39187 type:complete len:205 (-) Transcript_16641:31-645(-)
MASHRRQHGAAATEWDNVEGIFLRNIPAKCDEGILRTFFESKGLVDFEMEMARFPNGKSRGFATILCRAKSGIKDFVVNVHGQFVPGFHKPTALRCEPLRSQDQQRQQGRYPKAWTNRYGVDGVADVRLRSSESRNAKATGAKASNLVARGGAAGALVVAESIPVEAGHSGRLEAGYSGERSPIRSMPPIGVVQHADGTISFRL